MGNGKLILGGEVITSQEQLSKHLANLPQTVLSTIHTLDRDEVVDGLKNLVECLRSSTQSFGGLARAQMNAGLLIYDCIAAAGLTEFAPEIFGEELWPEIQSQIGS